MREGSRRLARCMGGQLCSGSGLYDWGFQRPLGASKQAFDALRID
jgi:hypothetical protein